MTEITCHDSVKSGVKFQIYHLFRVKLHVISVMTANGITGLTWCGDRYAILSMGVCATYMGFIYNEMASLPLDFGSSYSHHGACPHLCSVQTCPEFHSSPTLWYSLILATRTVKVLPVLQASNLGCCANNFEVQSELSWFTRSPFLFTHNFWESTISVCAVVLKAVCCV